MGKLLAREGVVCERKTSMVERSVRVLSAVLVNRLESDAYTDPLSVKNEGSRLRHMI